MSERHETVEVSFDSDVITPMIEGLRPAEQIQIEVTSRGVRASSFDTLDDLIKVGALIPWETTRDGKPARHSVGAAIELALCHLEAKL